MNILITSFLFYFISLTSMSIHRNILTLKLILVFMIIPTFSVYFPQLIKYYLLAHSSFIYCSDSLISKYIYFFFHLHNFLSISFHCQYLKIFFITHRCKMVHYYTVLKAVRSSLPTTFNIN